MPLPSPYLPDYSNQANQLSQLGQTLGQNRRRSMLAAALPGAMAGDTGQLQNVYNADPATGLQIDQSLRKQAAEQAAAAKEEQSVLNEQNRERMRESLVRAAGTIAYMDEADVPKYWGRIRADLVRENPELADSLPMDGTDPSVIALSKSIAAKEGILPEGAAQKNVVLGPGSRLISPSGEELAAAPFAPQRGMSNPTLKVTDQGIFSIDPGTRQAYPIQYGGSTLKGAPYDPNLKQQLSYAGEVGKQDAKLTFSLPEARARTIGVVNNLENFNSQVAELMEHPGLDNVTGWLMGRTPTLSQEGRNAQALIDNIKNQTFVATLQQMREMSKTGGAVGNVSDREGQRLENAVVALEQSQSPEVYRRRLQNLVDIQNEAITNVKEAFLEQYGQDPYSTRGQRPQPENPQQPSLPTIEQIRAERQRRKLQREGQ